MNHYSELPTNLVYTKCLQEGFLPVSINLSSMEQLTEPLGQNQLMGNRNRLKQKHTWDPINYSCLVYIHYFWPGVLVPGFFWSSTDFIFETSCIQGHFQEYLEGTPSIAREGGHGCQLMLGLRKLTGCLALSSLSSPTVPFSVLC